MTPTSKPSSAGLRFLARLKNAIDKDEGTGMASLCHHLSVQPPASVLPLMYTVYLTPDHRGMFAVTCREFPDLKTFGEDEEEALSMAEIAIEEALGTRPRFA
jgi:predicted RNase H-like HicB family nuclease